MLSSVINLITLMKKNHYITSLTVIIIFQPAFVANRWNQNLWTMIELCELWLKKHVSFIMFLSIFYYLFHKKIFIIRIIVSEAYYNRIFHIFFTCQFFIISSASVCFSMWNDDDTCYYNEHFFSQMLFTDETQLNF